MEYKWAEADGSVTSMSPTGSKVCCFFLGCFHGVFFVSIFVASFETSNFSKLVEKVSFYG